MNKQQKDELLNTLELCAGHIREEIGAAKDLKSVINYLSAAEMIHRAAGFVERQEISNEFGLVED